MKNLHQSSTRFSPSFYFIPILIFAILGLGKAVTITWDGSSNTDWTSAANWDSNSVPTASDNVIIPSGVPNDPIINTSVTITSLAISQGGKLTIQPSGTLYVDGAAASVITIRGQLHQHWYTQHRPKWRGGQCQMDGCPTGRRQFYNQAGGLINIDNANRHGLDLPGNFYNQGNLSIGQNGKLGTNSNHWGIQVDEAAFENTGIVQVQNSQGQGILDLHGR